MGCDTVWSDFSGTIFRDPIDEEFVRSIAYAAIANPRDSDPVRSMEDVDELIKKLKRFKSGAAPLWQFIDPFNKMIEGRPLSFLEDVTVEYACTSAHQLERRVIRPLQAVHDEGKKTGILSISYDYYIHRVLSEAGYRTVFDHLIASEVQVNGRRPREPRIRGFLLDIYRRGKAEIMEEGVFGTLGYRKENTAYLGDSAEDRPIAGLLPRGRFIVPFGASDRFKQDMAAAHGAFVPKNEKDLLRYLRSL